jgi:GNAT superfamily N-acetyltransferase
MTRRRALNDRVIEINRSDLPDCCKTLGRAFHGEHGIMWVAPDDRERKRVARVMYGSIARAAGFSGARITRVEGSMGFAIWYPWGVSMPSTLRMIRFGMFRLLRHGPALIRRAIGYSDTIDKMRKQWAPRPHVYLAQLGVDPAEQGKGLGGTPLDEGLAWAFTRDMSVYLDTTNPDARRLYEHKGFEVVGDAKLRGNGPLSYAMLANPTSTARATGTGFK